MIEGKGGQDIRRENVGSYKISIQTAITLKVITNFGIITEKRIKVRLYKN